MGKAGDYVSVKDAYEAGDRTVLVVPLDYKLIEMCPDEGTSVAGLYQIGSTVKEMQKRIREELKEAGQDPKLTPSSPILGGRLNTLHMLGLVKPVQMVGDRGARSWQATTKGKEAIAEWKRGQS